MPGKEGEAMNPINEPAFPSSKNDTYGPCGGMTLRDYLAAKAMQAWIIALSQRRSESGYTDDGVIGEASKLGYEQADQMLAERSKP